ncbi:MAG: hypothetical protein DRJ50_06900, partial [Actinobacteria bacterium]
MKQITQFLARGVVKWPVIVIAVTLVLTGFFAFFASQQEIDQGAEAFAPDTPEFDALITISEEFSGAGESTVQVIFNTDDGDVITAAGLQAYMDATAAIEQSAAAPLLKDRPGGDIVGFMAPVLVGLQMQAASMEIPLETIVENITDDQVKQVYTEALAQMPPEAAAQTSGTLSSDASIEGPSASAGLMIVFLNTSDLEHVEIELPPIEADMAEELAAVPTDGIEIMPFSIELLFSSADEFGGEIGRLFLYAFLVILLILGFVYWTKPAGGYTRLRALRRSAADTALTLVVIVSAIMWMNGIGVLLGPDYIGWIGQFNPMLQILPVLLIGLGVDFAIHITSRYREEVGQGKSVKNATGGSIAVVGIALLLATVTTGVGFLTNIVNPIGAIKDFGILAAIGIGVAFLLMVTFLPAFRLLLDRRAEKRGVLPVEAFAQHGDRILPKYMGKAALLAEHVPVVTIVVALLLGGLGAFGLSRLDTTFDFTDFLPEDNPHVVSLDLLTEKFAGGFEQTDVLVEGDVATPETYNAMVASLNAAAGVPNVATFEGHAVATSPVSVIAQLTTPPEFGGNPDVFDAEFSQVAVANGLQQNLTVSTSGDVDAIYRAAFESSPNSMSRVLSESDGEFDLALISITTTAGSDDNAINLADDLDVAFEPVEQAGSSVVVTSQTILSSKIITSLQSSQIWSLVITLIAATLILVIAFWFEVRRPFLGVITMLPVALVVLWVFGIMAARGISFNVVTAMIANLAIGIGVPYTIHITLRYLEDRQIHDSRDDAIRETTRHTGGALAGSAL